MESFLLTDWTTISADGGVGVANVTSVPQSASEWLDLGAFEDATFTLDVREVTGAVSISYETSPTREDGLFVPMLPVVTLAVGVRSDLASFQFASFPLARYVRWRLSNPGAAGTWGATFRVWVAAHGYGGV